jgi:hypothetical protein
VIEAKCQSVLNILTQQNFEDAEVLGKALLGRWWFPVGPKLVSDQKCSTSSGNYRWSV